MLRDSEESYHLGQQTQSNIFIPEPLLIRQGTRVFLIFSGKTSNKADPPTAPALPKKLKMIIKPKMVIADLSEG